MSVNRSIIPKDSILNYFIDRLSITECPVSYQIMIGLAAIGTCLRRQVYIDDIEFKIFPNLSVLLIGPSGIGKDVAINAGSSVVENVGITPVFSGRTIEFINKRLMGFAAPAAACIPAPEFTAFLGGKDYQKSMVQELTNLLTTGEKVDVSSKGEGEKFIWQPTLAIMGGSTNEWLHKAMPEGSLEGGFIPRFIITCEEYGTKNVAWVKFDTTYEDREKAKWGKIQFENCIREIVMRFSTTTELIPLTEAIDYYRNWYCNRFSYFGKHVQSYANRSRGQMHKIAMLSAVSRFHNYMDLEDYQFAGNVMNGVAESIDKAMRKI